LVAFRENPAALRAVRWAFHLSPLPMTHLRTLALAVLLALGGPAAFATDYASLGCGASCQRMIVEAQALDGQGKYQEALE
jgi:hypothetical protein